VHYVNNTVPSFAVSRFLGQQTLGFFSRASLLVGLPQTFLTQGITKTLYPIYPRFRDDRAECRRMMADVVSVTTTVMWPLFATLAALSPLIVEILLGRTWMPVAAIVGPLCLYAAMNFAYSIVVTLVEAFGYLRQIWMVQTGWTIVLVAAIAIGIREGADARAIVLVAAVVQLAVHAVQVALIAREGYVDVGATVFAELCSAVLAGAWYVGIAVAVESTSGQGMTTRIGVSCLALAALTVLTFLVLPRLPAGRALAGRGIGIGPRRFTMRAAERS
jgi:O-antigen/teichoic acid export membrane protein